MSAQNHQASRQQDEANTSKGFIAALKPCVITGNDGCVVWNNDEYDFLQRDCPPTAHPKLWRQSQLCQKQGLFEVCPHIYQIRGFDISNMTFIESKEGVIVVDTLTSVECATAAMKFYRSHRGERPVTGLLLTHTHMDHVSGASAVLPEGRSIPVVVPEGFVKEFTSEHVYAGDGMARRAAYMFGSWLPGGPEGQIGCGLGVSQSKGSMSFIRPTHTVAKTGEEMIIDDVRIQFQIVSGTEAPAEFNLFFPDFRAVLIAECATNTMHNIITLRGAQVRDAKAWSRCLDESLVLFGQQSDVLLSSHHWPCWGQANIEQMLSEQRDLYAFLHDQTVRMINLGMNGLEIAETMVLPTSLQNASHIGGYYGSISHNVKGIYQRYMTWFDGNPAHLWQYPRTEEGKRYVACFGGVDALISKSQEFIDHGDLRFAATLLDHAVAAEPTNLKARGSLASVYEGLGFGAENGIWRNFYLTGAQMMRADPSTTAKHAPMSGSHGDMSVEQWIEMMSIRIDGERVGEERFVVLLHITDEQASYRLNVSNGALTYRVLSSETSSGDNRNDSNGGDLTLRLSKVELLGLMRDDSDIKQQKVQIEGDTEVLERLRCLTRD